MLRTKIHLFLGLVLLLAGCAQTRSGLDRSGRRPGKARVEALLISGGARRESNYRSHLEQLRALTGLLREAGLSARTISVFSADGSAPGLDLALREQGRYSEHWLLEGSRLGGMLPDLVFESSTLAGIELLPANKAALQTWFHVMADELGPGDTLLLYVTDHGLRTGRRGETYIALWHERLAMSELKAWLDELDPGVRVVLWMSQCYSGAFADLMYSDPKTLEVSGHTCGFFSSLPSRPAWGCFPEAVETTELRGHSLRMLEGLSPGASLAAAHRRTVLADHTPNVPNSSSQDYLRALLAREARRLRKPVDRVADGLLAQAWSRPGRWEWQRRSLDALAERLGVPGPIRSLMALARIEKDMAAAHKSARTVRSRWTQAQRALAKNCVQRFQADHDQWQGHTLRELFAAQGLEYSIGAAGEAQRRDLTARAISAIKSFTSRIDGLRTRLDRLHHEAKLAAEVDLRMARREAILLRMRVILEAMAGSVLADQDEDLRQAEEALVRCESWRLPGGPAEAPAPPGQGPALPALADDLSSLERLRPSWLGVRYGPEDPTLVAEHGLGKGAVVVREVVPDSPAEAAGLRTGDTVVGLAGQAFEDQDSLWETVMQHAPGDELRLDVLRADQRLELVAGLQAFPDVVPAPPSKLELEAPAPDFSGLRSIRGNLPNRPPVLLFFFATWCGPCKRAAPMLIDWEKDQGIPVIAVTDEDEAKVGEFFGKYDKPFPARVAIDPRGLVTDAYRATAFPTFVLVGAKGEVLGYGRGADALEQEAFRDPD